MTRLSLRSFLPVAAFVVVSTAAVGRAHAQYVTTIAGDGVSGSTDGIGTAARFGSPQDVAVDSTGNLWVVENRGSSNRTLRRIDVSSRSVTTVALPMTASIFTSGIAVDAADDVLIADSFYMRILRYSPKTESLVTIAGSAIASCDLVDSAIALRARFCTPTDVAVGPDGRIVIADTGNHAIRVLAARLGGVSTLAGNGDRGFVDGTGGDARFNGPYGVAVGANGTVYVADRYNHAIRQITPDGVVTTLAGSGDEGDADGTGTAARFSYPDGVAVGPNGDIYVAELGGHRIRQITPAGAVTTLAGNGVAGFRDGPVGRFDGPTALIVDADGIVYAADTHNHAIRRIGPFDFSRLAVIALAPQNLAALVSGTQIAVSWSAVAADSVSYLLEAGSAPGKSDVFAQLVGPSTAVTVNAMPGTYYIRVRARTAQGDSPVSAEVMVRVDGGLN